MREAAEMKNNLSTWPYSKGVRTIDYLAWKEAFEAEMKTENLDYLSKYARIALQRQKHVMFGVVNSFHCGFIDGYRFARKEVLGIEGEAK